MREQKIPQWASNANYSTGSQSGNPTKIVPSATIFGNGMLPDAPFAAQHDSYWRYWMQRQVEYSALLALKNWRLISNAATPWGGNFRPEHLAGNTPGGPMAISGGANDRLAFMTDCDVGFTTVTIAPSSGVFVPARYQAVAWSSASSRFVFGGSNSTQTRNCAWTCTATLGTLTEHTLPVGVSDLAALATDPSDGTVYGFCSDALHSIVRYSGGSWTLLGTVGGGYSGGTETRLTVLGGLVALWSPGGGASSGGVEVTYASAPYSSWTTRTISAVGSTTISAVGYSSTFSSYRAICTNGSLIEIAGTPAGALTTQVAYFPTPSIAGAVTDVVVCGMAGDTLYYADDTSAAAQSLSLYNALGTVTGKSLLTDGRRLFYLRECSGNDQVFASLRS